MSDNPTQQNPDSRSFEERVFARFDALDSRISSLEVKVDEMNGRLTTLEDKVDARLRETRPIWEAVQVQLEGVQAQLGDVKNRMESVEKEVKALGHAVLLIHDDNLHICADQRDLRERVEKLESQQAR